MNAHLGPTGVARPACSSSSSPFSSSSSSSSSSSPLSRVLVLALRLQLWFHLTQNVFTWLFWRMSTCRCAVELKGLPFIWLQRAKWKDSFKTIILFSIFIDFFPTFLGRLDSNHFSFEENWAGFCGISSNIAPFFFKGVLRIFFSLDPIVVCWTCLCGGFSTNFSADVFR